MTADRMLPPVTMFRRNNRKHDRRLRWSNATGESVITQDGRIYAGLTDESEPDRRTILDLSPEDAVRLAAKLARHAGYRLVEVSHD